MVNLVAIFIVNVEIYCLSGKIRHACFTPLILFISKVHGMWNKECKLAFKPSTNLSHVKNNFERKIHFSWKLGHITVSQAFRPKILEKTIVRTRLRRCVYQGSRNVRFSEFWRALFPWNLRLESRPFPLLLTTCDISFLELRQSP